jgi:hypothetical protein
MKVSLVDDQDGLDEGTKGNLQAYVQSLNVPQKVQLAAKGNKEVRKILSQDTNPMVARAVIGSPRLSDADVLAYASSPLTNDEILRSIAANRSWMTDKQLSGALVGNPRTPPPISIRLLRGLVPNELALVVKNRSVSPIVRREAQKLLIERRK